MTRQERLLALIERARELRGEADRLAADYKRDGDYTESEEASRAKELADAIDRGVQIACGRSLEDD